MFNIHLVVERWKYNKNYNLWVSTEGRVKRTPISAPLKPKVVSNNGYLRIKISNKLGRIYLHRLVLETWAPQENMTDLTVDHLNHNKRDCSLRNLEWCTSEENKSRAERDLEKPIWGVAVRGEVFLNSNHFASWVAKEKGLINDEAYRLKKEAKKEWERLVSYAWQGDFSKSSDRFYGLNVMAIKI